MHMDIDTCTYLQSDAHDPTRGPLSKLTSTFHSLPGALRTGAVPWLSQVSAAGISCVLEAMTLNNNK